MRLTVTHDGFALLLLRFRYTGIIVNKVICAPDGYDRFHANWRKAQKLGLHGA